MKVPGFLKQVGNALLYNQDDSTLVYYIPEKYFSNSSKIPVAYIEGSYVCSIGIFNWAIIDKNGKRSELKAFTFPTRMLCKPSEVENVKNLKLGNTEPSDYRLLKFKKGDEAISQTKVPQLIDNVETMFKMAVLVGKIPTTIPYDKLWELFVESARLNGFSFNVSVQLFGILLRGICRDPNDISKMFVETSMKDMNNYRFISITQVPKYISPYTAITSENWDESLRAAILMKDKEDAPSSPLEKVMTQ